jgi:hypothetical protein
VQEVDMEELLELLFGIVRNLDDQSQEDYALCGP